MRLIVGLGNPGEKYENTRHNLGFMVVNRLATRIGSPIEQKKKKTLYAKTVFAGEKLILLKPQTFMNLSGEAVLYMASFLKVPPPSIIVVSDDFNLPFGKIRIRSSGSAGGHNGIQSLIDTLKSEDFLRVRMGIGPGDTSSFEASRFVLQKFSKDEMQILPRFTELGVEAVITLLEHSLEKAMNEYNGKVAFPVPEDN